MEGTQGVVITQVTPDSPADIAHLSTGMAILEVNRKPVTTVGELTAMVKESNGKDGLRLARSFTAGNTIRGGEDWLVRPQGFIKQLFVGERGGSLGDYGRVSLSCRLLLHT